ncbi:MAG: sarcosine oxidase, partial [Pseudonocardiales bacterium]|nr:sarcosine oxidase [Pseudonocardiales bacterium]
LYVSLTGRAFELWRELEQTTDTQILRMLGGLDFGSRRDVPKVAALLADAGVPHEVLPAAAAASRWPGMAFAGEVVYHEQAGTMDAAGAVAAFLADAQRRGATVRLETAAVAVGADGVRLADGSTLPARCVVVAAGGWIGPLLDGVVELPPLRVTQQQIFHFPRLDTAAPPWPSVIHEPDEHPVYHLAGGRDGGAGDDRKVAEHDAGKVTGAADRDGAVEPASRARMIEYVRRWLPGLDPTPRSEATCLYTQTPSEDFILDRVGNLVVCSPCSGHGAKFAPLIGELVADLVLGVGDVPDRFRLVSHLSGRRSSVSL